MLIVIEYFTHSNPKPSVKTENASNKKSQTHRTFTNVLHNAQCPLLQIADKYGRRGYKSILCGRMIVENKEVKCHHTNIRYFFVRISQPRKKVRTK
jgi:hypothetical protein